MLPMACSIVAVVNYDVIAQMRPVLERVVSRYSTTVVFDESWRIKDKSTRVAQAAVKVADHCQRVLCMSGTPVGQGVGDLWMQLRVVEGKEPPEMETYKEWCDAYESTTWVTDSRGRTREKKTGCKDPVGMMRRLGSLFYRATKSACLDLPEKRPVVRVKLKMPPSLERVYRSVERDGEAALGDNSSLMGERTTALRLQQITGGFLFNPDGTYSEEEAGQTHDLRLMLMGSPKLEWCIDFARDQLAGDATHRVIFWHKFNAEVEHYSKRLGEVLGPGRVVAFTGATKQADWDAWKREFNSRDPDGVQVVCAQIKKLAYGENMQACDTNVYVSHTWSHIEKSQSSDRSHRIGRVGPVSFVELVMEGTIDETILACTDSLRDMQDRLAPDTVGAEMGEE
jgi:SNF2 family DNA or RNA helicase